MTGKGFNRRSGSPSNECRLVIVHETEEALVRATALCDKIMERCWEHVDMQMSHWPMAQLTEPESGDHAVSAAASADILVIAAQSEGPFPVEFMVWTERWLIRRERREGALVGLLGSGGGERPSTVRETRLHHLALRAGMDYLHRLPETPSARIPDLTEWCSSRATMRTGTLDQIIRNEPKSSER